MASHAIQRVGGEMGLNLTTVWTKIVGGLRLIFNDLLTFAKRAIVAFANEAARIQIAINERLGRIPAEAANMARNALDVAAPLADNRLLNEQDRKQQAIIKETTEALRGLEQQKAALGGHLDAALERRLQQQREQLEAARQAFDEAVAKADAARRPDLDIGRASDSISTAIAGGIQRSIARSEQLRGQDARSSLGIAAILNRTSNMGLQQKMLAVQGQIAAAAAGIQANTKPLKNVQLAQIGPPG